MINRGFLDSSITETGFTDLALENQAAVSGIMRLLVQKTQVSGAVGASIPRALNAGHTAVTIDNIVQQLRQILYGLKPSSASS